MIADFKARSLWFQISNLESEICNLESPVIKGFHRKVE